MSNVETPEAAPKVRHKSFTYQTGVQWTAGRSGVVSAAGKPELAASSPPEFKGEAGKWTPEDFFVAAIDLCTMTTFLAFAERTHLPLRGYRSAAEGRLEFVGDGYRFTEVVLRPVITVGEGSAVAAAERLMHDAHAACLVGRSVVASVVIEPRIEVVPS